MKSFQLILLSVAVLSTGRSADPSQRASDWPQWRGPAATGVAPLGHPPVTWSETEHVKWKVKTPGFGSSTPIVWEDQVFVLTAVPNRPSGGAPVPPAPAAEPPPGGGAPEQPGGRRRGPGGGRRAEQPSAPYQFLVLSLDRKTGKTRWQQTAREEVPHEGHHHDHGFASASPVTDGEHLYVSFGSRGLYCYDLQGNRKWDVDLGDMQTRNAFGEGTSPALHGNTVVINWDHEGADFIVALDKRTGKELWRQTREEPTSWATPLIIENEGKTQVIVSATNRIRGYDLATGAPMWECGGMTTNVIPTPVSDAGVLYATSGFRGSSLLAIRLGKTGDLTDSEAIVWKHGKGTPYVPSPLLTGGRLYFFAGNDATLSCFQAATGKSLFAMERVAGLGGVYASPVAAAGRVYLVGREGKTVVINDSDTLQVVATNTLEDRFDASAAIAGSEIFLRGHDHVYCLAE